MQIINQINKNVGTVNNADTINFSEQHSAKYFALELRNLLEALEGENISDYHKTKIISIIKEVILLTERDTPRKTPIIERLVLSTAETRMPHPGGGQVYQGAVL